MKTYLLAFLLLLPFCAKTNTLKPDYIVQSQSDKAIIKQLWSGFVKDHTFTLMSDNGYRIGTFYDSTATKVKVYDIKKLKLEFGGIYLTTTVIFSNGKQKVITSPITFVKYKSWMGYENAVHDSAFIRLRNGTIQISKERYNNSLDNVLMDIYGSFSLDAHISSF